LKAVNELLKKLPDGDSRRLRAKRTPVAVYRFINEHRGEYTIKGMAKVFGISCSAYYKWLKKKVSE
jgi:hypothetical protein